MPRSRMLLLGVTAGLLLLLLAACGIGDENDDPATATVSTTESTATPESGQAETSTSEPSATPVADEPTVTPSDEEPTATQAEEEPTATESQDEPTATAEATEESVATEESSGARLVGLAVVEDDTEDVSNLLGNEPDEPMPGIDLTRVQIEGDGENLTVTIETAGDIAAELSDDDAVSFDVHLWQDDMPAYAMSFHYSDGEWEATITDFSEFMEEETVETEITLAGNTLSATFPGELMPELEESFQWYSSVMLGASEMPDLDSWFDGAPENIFALLAEPDEFVEFPQ